MKKLIQSAIACSVFFFLLNTEARAFSMTLSQQLPLHDTVYITALVENAIGVDLYLTDTPSTLVPIGNFARNTTSPMEWNYAWDTTQVSNGSHYIVAKARLETTIQTSDMSSLAVTVYNAPASSTDASTQIQNTQPPPIDTTPPILSSSFISKIFASDTQTVPISITTNEHAVCKYATSPEMYYQAMSGQFATTDGITHSKTLSQLSNGITYNLYIRCKDTTGNENANDYLITISIAPTLPPPSETVTPTPIPTPTPTSTPIPTPSPKNILIRLSQSGIIHGNVDVYIETDQTESIGILLGTRGSEPVRIGEAGRVPGSVSQWILKWDSSKTPNGTYLLEAHVRTPTGIVIAGPIEIIIANELMPTPQPTPTVQSSTLSVTPEQKETQKVLQPQPIETIKQQAREDIQTSASLLKTLDQRPTDVLKDTDIDGIIDYDEISIYGTNPKNRDTDSDGMEDGAELLAGKNPKNGLRDESIFYEDPRSGGTVRDDLLTVATSTNFLLFGTAPPNSLVTLYILSIPVIVTVKADADGAWSYTVDRELENGKHELYVTLTNSKGAIIAKSSPIPFVKEAEAITLEKDRPLHVVTQNEKPGFFESSEIIIGGCIIIIALFIALFAVGKRFT